MLDHFTYMKGILILSSNWDKRYLDIAIQIASWSKDPSKQCGAVCVGDNGQILSQGYNGFPRGVLDSEERLNDRPTKYKFNVHAEQNAIYNATLNGSCLKGSTMYVYGLPVCNDCCKGIIQVGIKKVVMPAIKHEVSPKWNEAWMISETMFNEAGVEIVYV